MLDRGQAGRGDDRVLVMWDVDRTLLRGGGLAGRAWQAAFTEVTGVAYRQAPDFSGRTDLDLCAETFATHGVTTCTPEVFFERYTALVHADRHQFAEQGEVLPGVEKVLAELAADPAVVQTLVTGNVPAVAAAKVAAFGLGGLFDAEVGGYGTDDAARAGLVRRSLERARAKYGVDFRAVVVGDTGHDVTAALAHGATAIAVATGSVPAAELAAAGAHVVLDDLSDTAAALAAIRRPVAPPG